MKRNTNSRVSYKDRVGQNHRDRKGKNKMKSKKSSAVSYPKQYRYIKIVIVSS